MTHKVFIDGREGTTGLRIFDRLQAAAGIELLLLPEEERKDPAKRKAMILASDLAFLCLPDGAAREAAAFAEGGSVKLIDASTAHRVHPGWVYGFPELSENHRQGIAEGSRVAVPGCHASGFAALIYPLVKAGILKPDAALSCFSVTGYSGGGKKMIAEYESGERDGLLDSPRQYATGQNHKHLPEMAAVCGLLEPPVFLPVVADYYSGMTVSVPLHKHMVSASPEQISEIYQTHYSGAAAVNALPYSDGDMFVAGNLLSGSDRMELRVFGNGGRMVLTACFDNLGKGASGAAVQCMNLMLGRGETEGLNL